jgi:cytochrome c peroxidase
MQYARIGWACVGLSIIAAAASGGCDDADPLSATERDQLAPLAISSTPKDPSNRVADDPRAAVLGKRLFFDPGFAGPLGPLNDGVSHGSLGRSGDVGKVSCASCHDLTLGGSDHRSGPGNTSLAAGYGQRNAATVIDAALSDVAAGGWQNWDGGADSLWAQPIAAMENEAELNSSRLAVAHRIYDQYRTSYEALFGALPDLREAARFPRDGKPGTPAFDNLSRADQDAIDLIIANVGKSLEAYQRLLVSSAFSPSPFDRFLAGDATAMSAAAIRGAALFVGKAACDECHRGPQLSDAKFHNTGVPQRGENLPVVDVGRVDGAVRAKANRFARSGKFSDDVKPSAVGDSDTSALGSFKTPTLRNVAKTAPYMHDGVFVDLRAVVEHYNRGGGEAAVGAKSPRLAPLFLSDQEMRDLVEFMEALSDGDPLPSLTFPEGLLVAPSR